MPTATDYLDAVLADDCTIQFTGLDQTMNWQEVLDWSETDFCHGCNDYTIIRDAANCIAGTHMAWGNGDDGPWKSKVFFLLLNLTTKLRNGTCMLDQLKSKPPT